MKKVCMVVLNSVSHDARVLKEAEAVREAGFAVTIIGIQDANNNVPVSLLDNGVLIRRVAWQSTAFRPWFFPYFGRMALALALAGLLAGGFVWLTGAFPDLVDAVMAKGNMERLASSFSWQTAATFAVALLALAGSGYYAYHEYADYKRRSKSSKATQKREKNELLKYAPVLSQHRGETPVAEEPKARASHSPLADLLPRPLMQGVFKLMSGDQIGRWKVVFAREKCVYALLKEEMPDIVHAHDISALPVAAQYAKQAKVKLVFDAHEIYDHLAQAEDDMAELNSNLLSKYSRDVDAFVTINDSIAHYYRDNYPGFPPAVVVKNAAKQAEPVPYDGRLHEAAGLPLERKIMVYQGGFAPKRGLIQLLLSAEYLNSDWALVFMGWGRLEDELHRITDAVLVRNPELDKKIRFVPRVKQDELPLWSAGAKLGAIPYENTGLNHWFCNPNKLWEYPNAGVPIVASPFPEMRAIIEKYELGWFLPDPLSPCAIAAVVNELTDEQLAEASANCRKFMQADNWQVYANRLKKLYGGMR